MEILLMKIAQKTRKDPVTWDRSRYLLPPTNSNDPLVHFMKLLHQYKVKPEKYYLERKSLLHAKDWILEANNYFSLCDKSFDCMKSVCLYIHCISVSPIDSVELSKSYAGLAEVLFHTQRFKQCVRCIDYCINHNYPSDQKGNLLLRKVVCMRNLDDTEGFLKAYAEAKSWIKKHASKEDKQWMENNLEACSQKPIQQPHVEIKNPIPDYDTLLKEFDFELSNKELPGVSDALALKYDEINGRHLVATRDIKSGEILAKVAPYSIVTNTKCNLLFCWGCLVQLWDCVPCDYCAQAMYCTNKCKKESWKRFHYVECSMLPYFIEMTNEMTAAKMNAKEYLKGVVSFDKDNYISATSNIISALRMTVLAVKEMGSISKLMEEMQSVDQGTDPRRKGFTKKSKTLCGNKYRSVYGLSTLKYREGEELYYLTIFVAIYTVYYLATTTIFFGKQLNDDWMELLENKEVMFIANNLLKNSMIHVNYGYSVKEFTTQPQVKGDAIFPALSYINHNCDPNVFYMYNTKLAYLFSIRPIKKGEQIFRNYIPIHYNTDLHTRRKYLLNRYKFKCTCTVCEENWPRKDKLLPFNIFVSDPQIGSVLAEHIKDIYKFMSNPKCDLTNEERIRLVKKLNTASELFHKYIHEPCSEVELIKSTLVFMLDSLS